MAGDVLTISRSVKLSLKIAELRLSSIGTEDLGRNAPLALIALHNRFCRNRRSAWIVT
jgi:hypothetical protein